MSQINELPITALQFYATASYTCSYLPQQTARSQVATPSHLVHSDMYGDLVNAGFRRSGLFTYRPYCDHCKACIATRIPVEHFVPTRSQQRAHKQHANLETHVLHLSYTDEHYALYRHYQEQRHHDGDMNRDDQEQYTQFLLQSRVNSRLVEFRDGPEDPEPGRLRMVSIIDIVEAGISSVYTFYDTTVSKASYGTYSILWQIEQVRLLKRPYLYLGYYIKESQKMAYKSKFKAIEGLIDNLWQPLHTR